MDKRKIPEDAQPKVVELMIDDLNRVIRDLAEEFDSVVYVDCRNVAEHPWDDAIHPTSEGYAAVAEVFRRAIEALP